MLNKFRFLLFTGLFALATGLSAQTVTKTSGGYTYSTVPGDPLDARIYTLANGLKVYMTVYKAEPRIQTYIAVKAGSKNDPAETTGLAHYLEHMVFKGTSHFGSQDYEKEKALLNEIERLFEYYRTLKNPEERKALYIVIDSLSGVAAKYAIANEYDKMLSNIGAKGTNAYTSLEQTVYVNDIPSNSLEKWLKIEAERFSELVPRLFHTELEAVYEEKNRSLDSDRSQAYYTLMEGLFPTHTYGTQTTIGTVEHLKNPSITAIKKYFDTYYVPNNMAICLSGDFDPEVAIKQIEATFGRMKPKEIPKFEPSVEKKSTAPVVKTVVGPEAEFMAMGYRFPGVHSRESLLMEMAGMVLSNGQAGIYDLNLNQKQKVMGAYAYTSRMHDYSMMMLGAAPKEGQTLQEVQKLLLNELELLKTKKYDNKLLTAIINDYKISKMREYESNRARANAFVTAFILDYKWEDYVKETDQISKITKNDLAEFAKKYLNEPDAIVYKVSGTDSTRLKVEKPLITPVSVNRDVESGFVKYINALEQPQIEPVFLDYEKDLTTVTLPGNIEMTGAENKENSLFNLYYQWEFGTNANPKYALAAEYFDYLGAGKLSGEQLKKELYVLGTSFDIIVADERIHITVTGLKENMTASLQLLETWLTKPKANPAALKELVSDIKKSRADAKKNKKLILERAMVSYAKYGSKSPFTNNLSNAELDAVKPDELIELIQGLSSYKYKVLYYGPGKPVDVAESIALQYPPQLPLKSLPEVKKFEFRTPAEPEVYFVNFDMVQAEVVLLARSENYSPEKAAAIALFNEYFGGNMSAIVFQEIRESKALAYSAYSVHRNADKQNTPNYSFTYIGTQADKLPEAMKAMTGLLEDMPESETAFANSKESLINTLRTDRIIKSAVLLTHESALRLGLKEDIRKRVYEEVQKMTLADIKKFHREYVAGQVRTLLVIGSKDKVDMDLLKQYGKVKELTLEDVFGY